MKIIIVQAEIEQAIRDYINSQLNVKDGHEIQIDLAATRGENGFTATIDIVAASDAPKAPVIEAPAPAPAPTPAPTPAPKKETKAEAAVVASTASVKVAPPPVEKKEEPVSNQGKEEPPVDGMKETSAPTNTSSDTPTPGDAAPSSTEAPQAAPSGDAPAAPARSLFAGLKKPVNS